MNGVKLYSIADFDESDEFLFYPQQESDGTPFPFGLIISHIIFWTEGERI